MCFCSLRIIERIFKIALCIKLAVLVSLAQNGQEVSQWSCPLVGVNEKCVRTTKGHLEQFGTVKDLSRSGRPTKMSERDSGVLFRKVRVDSTLSNRELAAQFTADHPNVSVSRDTVRRALKTKGIGSYTATRKPMLTVRDRLARMKWCKERLHWPVEKWARVLWSDEANF